MHEDDLYPHRCITQGCTKIVEFDDEPWCFEHSPDEGSSLHGWSAHRALVEAADDIIEDTDIVVKPAVGHAGVYNIFDKRRE